MFLINNLFISISNQGIILKEIYNHINLQIVLVFYVINYGI